MGNVYMLPSGVEGESLEVNHVGWIECTGVNYSVNSPTSYGAGGGSAVGAPEPSPISIFAKQGKHSPVFQTKQFNGTHFDEVKFEFLKQTGTSAGEKFLILTIRHAFVTNFTPDLSGQGEPTEHIVMTYEEIEIDYWGQNSQGALSSVGATKYNLKQKQTS